MNIYKNVSLLKADARESLLGNLGVSVPSVLLYMISVISLACMISTFQTTNPFFSLALTSLSFLVINIVSGLLEIGLDMEFLRFQYGKKARVGDLFTAFRFNSNTCVETQSVLGLMNLACMMPALIYSCFFTESSTARYIITFGILLGLGLCCVFFLHLVFALVPYLLLDFPQLTWKQVLRVGVKMMQGHKARLFRLYLSFIPLISLGMLSLGFANMWIDSYIHAAAAAFYKDRIANTRA